MANSNNCACTDKENVCSLKVSRNKVLIDIDELREIFGEQYSSAYDSGSDSASVYHKLVSITTMLETCNKFYSLTKEEFIDKAELKDDIMWLWCQSNPEYMADLKHEWIKEYGDVDLLPWTEEEWSNMLGGN